MWTHALACVPLPRGGRRVRGRTDFQLSWSWLDAIVLIDDRDLRDKRCASIRRPISRQALFKSSYSLGSLIYAFWAHCYISLLYYIRFIRLGAAARLFKAHQCKFFPPADPPSSFYIVRNSKRRSSVSLLQSSRSAVNKSGRFRLEK